MLFALFRIVESSELKEIFEGHLVQLPCNGLGHVQLDQVVQSLVQTRLECLWGWGINRLSAQPVPVPQNPYCKTLLPSIQSKSLLF